MSGPGAVYTPFSETGTSSSWPSPWKTWSCTNEQILREAGLRLAVHLARCCLDSPVDIVEIYERERPTRREEIP